MKIYILIFVLILSGCVTQEIKTNETLTPDEGLLVVGLNTNWGGHDNPILANLYLLFIENDDSGLAYKKLSFQGEDHITTTKLPSGNYHFYGISFGTRGADLKDGSNFRIYPGKITYVGTIDMQLDMELFSVGAITNVTDETDRIKGYLNKTYPDLVRNKEIVTELVPIEFDND